MADSFANSDKRNKSGPNTDVIKEVSFSHVLRNSKVTPSDIATKDTSCIPDIKAMGKKFKGESI